VDAGELAPEEVADEIEAWLADGTSQRAQNP
jgi:hypothetical protein